MNENKYIGIFDSGFGGISVLNYCLNLMPNENYIYFGDYANSPFGTKNIDELKNIANNIICKLKQYDLKEIIIACGTMSTNIYNYICESFPEVHFVPTRPDFEHIFKPGFVFSDNMFSFNKNSGLTIKRHTKKILIIATSATCKSEYIRKQTNIYENIFDVYVEPADSIVKYVEENKVDTFAMRNYLEDLFKEYSDVDYLVLGCTHFPFAINPIKIVLGDKVKLIDGCEIAANNAKDFLQKNNLENPPDYKCNIKIIDTAINDERKMTYERLINNTSQNELKPIYEYF